MSGHRNRSPYIVVGQPPVVYDTLSQHSLPRQFNLSRCFALFPTSLTDTYGTSISQFHLVFNGWERAGAVMREVNAGKGAGAEVIRAMGYNERLR